CGWVLRLIVIVGLLVSVHPALILLAVFAVPTVCTSTWRPAVERTVWESRASAHRLARHLFTIATTAAPGKEVRVTGIGMRLVGCAVYAGSGWVARTASHGSKTMRRIEPRQRICRSECESLKASDSIKCLLFIPAPIVAFSTMYPSSCRLEPSSPLLARTA